VVAIAAGAIAVYGLHLMQTGVLQADNIGPLVAVIACGVCLGFLPHNFHPARIFMGDAGALFLGLLMAVSTMVIGGRTTDVTGQTYFFFAPLLIPLFILGVPLVDMAFAFVRRTAKGTHFHSPDKDHIHHRLLRLGHGPRRTVVILWGWTAILSGFVLVPLYFPRGNTFIPLGAAAIVLVLYTWFHPGLRKPDPAFEDEVDEGASEDPGGADELLAPNAVRAVEADPVSLHSGTTTPRVGADGLEEDPAAVRMTDSPPSRHKAHETVLKATDAVEIPPIGGRGDRFVGGWADGVT
jgi:hypothetical protein